MTASGSGELAADVSKLSGSAGAVLSSAGGSSGGAGGASAGSLGRWFRRGGHHRRWLRRKNGCRRPYGQRREGQGHGTEVKTAPGRAGAMPGAGAPEARFAAVGGGTGCSVRVPLATKPPPPTTAAAAITAAAF